MNEGILTVAQRLERIEGQLTQIADNMSDLSSRDKADLVRLEHQEARISKVEAWQEWATRLILGAVILGILAFAWNF